MLAKVFGGLLALLAALFAAPAMATAAPGAPAVVIHTYVGAPGSSSTPNPAEERGRSGL